ncbi:MAG: hypothetical protein V1844_09890 [Pseudomonadota bacterium]
MKTLSKLMLFLLIVSMMLLSGLVPVVSADPVTEQLTKQPYAVTLSGETYLLSFQQGPFGPGYQGMAILSGRGASFSYPFQGFDSGLIQVDGLCDFYFAGTELVWVETELLILKAETGGK